MSKRDDLRRSLGGGGFRGMIADVPPPGLDPAASRGPDASQGVTRRKDVFSIPLEKIEPDPDQPRTEYDEDALDRLAESLKTRGQLQPIRVRKDEGRGVYVILLGERRYRAAKRAGLPELQCVVHDGILEPDEKLAVQLVENALREDLRPTEQARAYRRLLDVKGWSISQLAQELAVSQGSISKALTLPELPEAIQEAVDSGDLPASVAYEVSKIDDAELQVEIAQAAVSQGLKRDEVADVVRAVKAKRPAPASRPAPVTLDLGDGMTLKLTWKKANGVDAMKALRLAMKRLQAEAQKDEAA